MQWINKEKLQQMNEQDRQDFVLLNVLPPDEFNAKCCGVNHTEA
jgi:hypothetical protein